MHTLPEETTAQDQRWHAIQASGNWFAVGKKTRPDGSVEYVFDEHDGQKDYRMTGRRLLVTVAPDGEELERRDERPST